MNRRTLLAVCVALASVIAVWVAPSGGQEGAQKTIIGVPLAPAPASTTAVVGGAIEFVVAEPHTRAQDEERQKLHEQNHAYERSTRRLLADYRDAESSGDKSIIREKLAMVVRDHFEVHQQIRERELADLEVRLQRLRELHDRREQAKSEIVDRRIEQLVREADGLGWKSGVDDLLIQENELHFRPGAHHDPLALPVHPGHP